MWKTTKHTTKASKNNPHATYGWTTRTVVDINTHMETGVRLETLKQISVLV